MVGKGMEAERAAAMRVLRLRRAAGGAMATTSGGKITVADVSELESCASCAVISHILFRHGSGRQHTFVCFV